MIEFWFPRVCTLPGDPLDLGRDRLLGVLFVLNAALYRPFWFVRGVHPYDVSVYPEVAAIVFTNSLAFALLTTVAFLIFREALGSDRWGVFGLAATVCCSSYLFWSGNAKDHALVALLFAVALYCFTLYLYAGEPSLPLRVVHRRRVDGLRPAGTRSGPRRRVLPLRCRRRGGERAAGDRVAPFSPPPASRSAPSRSW
jgi:hypothetical protein